MKSSKYICRITWLLLIVMIASLNIASAQNSKKESAVTSLILSKNYVFEAQSATPMRGQVRQLTYGYDLTVTKDTIISHLPYFGRAYVAPMNPSEGGIMFTSTKNDYKVRARRKGGWEVSIETKDQGDNKKMTLSVQESGYATLQVTSNNRQPISFYGIVTERKNKK